MSAPKHGQTTKSRSARKGNPGGAANTIGIHEARSSLSKLVDRARKGEPFVITKHGKPIATLTGVTTRIEKKERRLGFLKGEFLVPDDFDRMGSTEIEKIFQGRS